MTQVAGIVTKKNAAGEITHVTIDVQKHKAVINPLLQKLGVIEKTKFQQECEAGYTIDETREFLHDHIKKLWQK